jgi:hypothetical protein
MHEVHMPVSEEPRLNLFMKVKVFMTMRKNLVSWLAHIVDF